jgi:hypothetical protein
MQRPRKPRRTGTSAGASSRPSACPVHQVSEGHNHEEHAYCSQQGYMVAINIFVILLAKGSVEVEQEILGT